MEVACRKLLAEHDCLGMPSSLHRAINPDNDLTKGDGRNLAKRFPMLTIKKIPDLRRCDSMFSVGAQNLTARRVGATIRKRTRWSVKDEECS